LEETEAEQRARIEKQTEEMLKEGYAKKAKAEIELRFIYHKPREGQPEKYTTLRDEAKRMALMINELCPDSREKSLAVTNLEQSIMWANAAIARRDFPVAETPAPAPWPEKPPD